VARVERKRDFDSSRCPTYASTLVQGHVRAPDDRLVRGEEVPSTCVGHCGSPYVVLEQLRSHFSDEVGIRQKLKVVIDLMILVEDDLESCRVNAVHAGRDLGYRAHLSFKELSAPIA
jgi:hypothetical protein